MIFEKLLTSWVSKYWFKVSRMLRLKFMSRKSFSYKHLVLRVFFEKKSAPNFERKIPKTWKLNFFISISSLRAFQKWFLSILLWIQIVYIETPFFLPLPPNKFLTEYIQHLWLIFLEIAHWKLPKICFILLLLLGGGGGLRLPKIFIFFCKLTKKKALAPPLVMGPVDQRT
jgi:hypothetical protein